MPKSNDMTMAENLVASAGSLSDPTDTILSIARWWLVEYTQTGGEAISETFSE